MNTSPAHRRGLNRRTFLKQTTAAAAAAGVTSLGVEAAENDAASSSSSPNEHLRIGVIGLRGRGRSHVAGFQRLPGVEVVALADIDENILGPAAEGLEKKTGRKVKRFVDLRALLDDADIDAVSIATPNHWHALAGIWAMQAGKHVYVEKPCCHNIWEGRQLVAAARRHNRLCQHGTQGRSSPAIREAISRLRDGVIGDVYMARGLCFKWRNTIGHTPDEPVPAGVHYDLWLGPAPKRPFSRNRFHYNWHWNWDYGNGDLGNQGVHEMDMARWGLNVGLPTKVQAAGGHFMFDDDQQTPNTLVCTYEYPEQQKLLVFEVRHWITNHEGFGSGSSNAVGVTFYGSEGFMRVRYFGYETFLGRNREPGPSGSGSSDEFGTFCRAVRSGRREDLAVDIEDGFLSSALCHLGNIAYRVGRSIRFDPDSQTIPGDAEAAGLLTRDYRSPFIVPRIV